MSLNRRTNQRTIDMVLVLVAIVWGSSYITTKAIVTHAPVLWFLTARFGVAATGFSLYGWSHLRRATKATWITGISLGVLLAGIFLTETLGIKYTTAMDAGFLISLNVVMVPWVEAIILHYPIRWPLVGAMGIAVLGTALVTTGGGHLTLNLGDGLILLAAALRATQMTLTKRWVPPERIDVIALNSLQFATVFIVCGILSVTNAIPGAIGQTFHGTQGALFWSVALYLGIVGTVIAFMAQMVSIQYTSPARVALLLGLEPAFAAVFSVIGGEQLTFVTAIGGGLIVLGTLWGRRTESLRQRSLPTNPPPSS